MINLTIYEIVNRSMGVGLGSIGKSLHGKKRLNEPYAILGVKRQARAAVFCAIKRGKIPKINTLNCAHCSKPAQAYHHYKGYEAEFRLVVEPLCHLCHAKTYEHRNQYSC
jgi:hypothetical protein